jgi:large subunit ribosomal protein L21
MQYAIIEISGKQFWVEVGKFYNFNRIPCKSGKRIILNRVLLLNNEGEILIGQPFLNNVKIQGKILQHLRDRKKIIYKMRSKKENSS